MYSDTTINSAVLSLDENMLPGGVYWFSELLSSFAVWVLIPAVRNVPWWSRSLASSRADLMQLATVPLLFWSVITLLYGTFNQFLEQNLPMTIYFTAHKTQTSNINSNLFQSDKVNRSCLCHTSDHVFLDAKKQTSEYTFAANKSPNYYQRLQCDTFLVSGLQWAVDGRTWTVVFILTEDVIWND